MGQIRDFELEVGMAYETMTMRDYLEHYNRTKDCYRCGSLKGINQKTRKEETVAEQWMIPNWMLNQKSSLFTRLMFGG